MVKLQLIPTTHYLWNYHHRSTMRCLRALVWASGLWSSFISIYLRALIFSTLCGENPTYPTFWYLKDFLKLFLPCCFVSFVIFFLCKIAFLTHLLITVELFFFVGVLTRLIIQGFHVIHPLSPVFRTQNPLYFTTSCKNWSELSFLKWKRSSLSVSISLWHHSICR